MSWKFCIESSVNIEGHTVEEFAKKLHDIRDDVGDRELYVIPP